MVKSSFFLVIFYLVLLVSPTILLTVNAQPISKPATPNFTVQTIDSSYDVPPTTSSTTNPYTGQVTTTNRSGYHVENKTTYIEIANQPFTPYQIQQNETTWGINLFYNIETKGHYANEWGNYRYNNGSGDRNLVQDFNAQFTMVPINDYLPQEGKIDFRVQALEGYQHGIDVYPGVPGEQWIITGSASDWSNIITLSITNGSVSVSPNEQITPTQTPNNTSAPSPTVPEIPITATLIAVLVVGSLFAVIGKKKLTLEHSF